MWRYIFIALCCASAAQATVEVRFADGAGGDSFTIANAGCPLRAAMLVIDLTQSAAGVVVDTEYGGRGTQDPLPMRVTAGDISLPIIEDGMQAIHVLINALDPGETAAFSLDVDETLSPNYGDRVSVTGSEIAGAGLTLSIGLGATTAAFGADGTAVIESPPTADGCLIG